ncbi:hypothetical protein PVK06_040169 [Gossypium arboreum]|uniref:Replication factor C C-terminal domain-containing protein n=1 Tax=Gossypium arboreum TaxID=29729 RepID=A0ABR0N4R2_GOSAR|nr:hypothetical protein PVK06_040169 [Gossypium arboreum]
MLQHELCSSRILSPFRDEIVGDEELLVLPRHTKVIVTGNNRTKSVLVGLQGVVKKAVGLGGWHWLVLKNGVEVKLQRNALSVLEHPIGNEVDDDHDFDNSRSGSDIGENDHVSETKTRKGLALIDIVREVPMFVFKIKMPLDVRVQLINDLADIEWRICFWASVAPAAILALFMEFSVESPHLSREYLKNAKWLNKQLSKLWPFVAEVHTLAFWSGVLDSLAVELKASKDFSKLYAGIAILWLHISLN